MFSHHYNDLRRGLPTICILRLLNKPTDAELRNSSENENLNPNALFYKKCAQILTFNTKSLNFLWSFFIFGPKAEVLWP